MIPKMEELKHEVGLRVAKRIIIFDIAIALQLILALYFKILSVALSGLVSICNFFEETFLPSSCLLASSLLRDAT